MKRFICLISIILVCISVASCAEKECSHEYKSTIVTSATCTEDGLQKYTCEKCDNYYEEIIKKTGHNNVLQKNGEDICSNCGQKTFATYSIKALSGIYSLLRSPTSSEILSIRAKNITWNDKDCIAISILLSAQNGFGGMSQSSYLTMIEVETGAVLGYDIAGDLDSKADYYHEQADYFSNKATKYSGNQAKEYLEKSNECLDISKEYLLEAQKVYRIQADMALHTEVTADLDYIIALAKEDCGLFN